MNDFSDTTMFCKKCLLHDTFWSGGNSWGIDHCPNCEQKHGIIFHETVMWEDMSISQRAEAKKLFEKWWRKYRITKEN